jgi:hypothetical protein
MTSSQCPVGEKGMVGVLVDANGNCSMMILNNGKWCIDSGTSVDEDVMDADGVKKEQDLGPEAAFILDLLVANSMALYHQLQ